MRRLVISPHLDDAVWSCGGRLSQWRDAGDEAWVLTVFDGDPPGEAGGVPSGTTTPARRRAENERALAALGVTPLGLGIPEAALRPVDGRAGRTSARRIVAGRRGLDEPLVLAVVDALRTQAVGFDEVVAPLGSLHVDHAIVRNAVLRSGIFPLTWYEEFPYVPAPKQPSLAPQWHPVDLHPWLAAALLYESQVSALFDDTRAFVDAVTSWAQERGREAGSPFAERVWRPISSK